MNVTETPGFILCMESEGYAKDRGDGWVVAYWDAIGLVWTIGYGSTGSDIKKGTAWTREHAVLRLQQGWTNAQAGVLRASPILSQYPLMLDAITDFAYNCGVGAYQASTLRRKVNAKDWQGAAAELPKWNHSKGKVVPGLTIRRQRERTLFLSQLSKAAQASQPSPTIPAPKTTPEQMTTPAERQSEPTSPVPNASPDSASMESTTDAAASPRDTLPAMLGRFFQSLADILRQRNRTTSDRRDEP